ncbi:hypothetical protein L208DRAFT_1383876 [Tricholoma matsutake]|nr:hypothetical protein L208DRAFT_1383876 [Tricholoma matsutake 945]
MPICWWSHSTRSLGNNVDRAGLLAGMRNRRQHPNYGLQTEPEQDHTVKKYDQSLLVVIGILDVLKHESNVGG